MSSRKFTVAVLVAGLALTGCGVSQDELLVKWDSAEASVEPGPRPAGRETPGPDTPPNHADNSRARLPGEMSPQDEEQGRRKAADVGQALEKLRREGRTGPSEVRPVLERLAGPAHLSVGQLPIGSPAVKANGSTYGIWIGRTAFVTGVVSSARAWANVNGHYPETRCMPPAMTQ
ncbi:hypothetical protein [Streptomyces sp. CAU 1734]|uniref:hypothetical protein n=1 Tax=Streptomyces sp. CAU 1734 TaxID=3140360 RepID=UPI00326020EF